jgi:hypothetical protein
MEIKSNFSHRLTVLGLVGGMLLALAGCETEATATVGDSVRSSGFLSDYSMLRRGEEGQAISVYWNDQADFNSYTKIMIEPVTIWANLDAEVNEVPAEERQELANAFHQVLHDTLSEDFEIVQVPGPNTIRLRVALTEAIASNPTLDTISTYVPQARLVSTIFTLGSDTKAFVGHRQGRKAKRATHNRACSWPLASTNAPEQKLLAAIRSIHGVTCARHSRSGRSDSATTSASVETSRSARGR